jgi:hypothetical protein
VQLNHQCMCLDLTWSRNSKFRIDVCRVYKSFDYHRSCSKSITFFFTKSDVTFDRKRQKTASVSAFSLKLISDGYRTERRCVTHVSRSDGGAEPQSARHQTMNLLYSAILQFSARFPVGCTRQWLVST